MQHIFNRIYIAPISALENQSNDDGAVMFITANTAVCDAIGLHTHQGDIEDHWFNLQAVRFKMDVGEFLFHHITYDEMITTRFDGSEDAFMAYLTDWPTNRRLVIYADLPELSNFMVRWFKTILPHATTESIGTLLHIISLREQLFVTNRKLSISVPVGRLYKTSIADELASAKFVIAPQQIETALPFDVELVSDQLGVEFLLATYLYNVLVSTPNPSLERVVEDKILRFVRRRLVYSLLDDKDGVVQSLYHAPMLFGEDVDVTDPANVAAFIATHPEHAWLFDDDFRPGNYQTVWATYNIAEVFTSGNQLIRKISKETGTYNSERHALLQKVFKNDVTLQDILDVELAEHFSCLILAAEVTDKAMNRYIIDYIIQLYKANDPSTLRCFTV